jgi:hypothetical protein
MPGVMKNRNSMPFKDPAGQRLPCDAKIKIMNGHGLNVLSLAPSVPRQRVRFRLWIFRATPAFTKIKDVAFVEFL